MRKMMEAADRLIHGRIAEVETQVEENDSRLDTLTADEMIDGSMANAFKVLRGSVGEDLDSLEEILDHINTLESTIMSVVQADRANSKVLYMPMSGDVTDMEIGTFIHNIGLASKASINEALLKLKDSVNKVVITLDENSKATLTHTLLQSNVVDLLLLLDDGREIPIIHFSMLDQNTLTAYNAFEGALAGKELHLHYIDFTSISI
jgi:hypothetical protein